MCTLIAYVDRLLGCLLKPATLPGPTCILLSDNAACCSSANSNIFFLSLLFLCSPLPAPLRLRSVAACLAACNTPTSLCFKMVHALSQQNTAIKALSTSSVNVYYSFPIPTSCNYSLRKKGKRKHNNHL